MSQSGKRPYASARRAQAAEANRARVLDAARSLFAAHGFDGVTISEIAGAAGVAASTVYAVYGSKEGILRNLMQAALFGERFRAAQARFAGVSDPVELLVLTAEVARAVYEGETVELGLMRGASAFSPALRRMEQEFETLRYAMQEERVGLLFAQERQRQELTLEEARRILWMYTSRDIYRMLVHESGWTADRYEAWLAGTLVTALVRAEHREP